MFESLGLKRSAVPGRKPVVSGPDPDLDYGDLGLNYSPLSPALYFRGSDDSLITLEPLPKTRPPAAVLTAGAAADGGLAFAPLPVAQTTQAGVVALATTQATLDGTDSASAVVPSGLAAVTAQQRAISDASYLSASTNLGGATNLLINGGFRIWQLGTLFNTTGYTADQWLSAYTGSMLTVTQQLFSYGQTDVPGNPNYYARLSVTSQSNSQNFVYFSQRIENVRTLSGSSGVLSFYAKADVPGPIALELVQNFGVGGSSTVTGIMSQKINLDSSWKLYKIPLTVPSIVNKIVAGDGSDYLALNWWFDAGSNYNTRASNLGQRSGVYYLSNVCLTPGTQYLPFSARPIATEWAMAQRYLEILEAGGKAPNGIPFNAFATPDTGVPLSRLSFKVTKRKVPQLAIGSAGVRYVNATTSYENLIPQIYYTDVNGTSLSCSGMPAQSGPGFMDNFGTIKIMAYL
jgi:hypothetical protein